MPHVDRKFIERIAEQLEREDVIQWATACEIDLMPLINTAKAYQALDDSEASGVALFQLGYEVRRAQEKQVGQPGCGGRGEVERPAPHFGTEEDDWIPCPGCAECMDLDAAEGQGRR